MKRKKGTDKENERMKRQKESKKENKSEWSKTDGPKATNGRLGVSRSYVDP